MTMSILYGVEEGTPASEPIGFVLADNRLVTVRYVTPKPIRAFATHVRKEPEIVRDSMTALYRLLDAIIDRLADELEDLGREIDRISNHIFREKAADERVPAARLTALLTRIGRNQALLARARETAVSTGRLISFLGGSSRLAREEREHREHVATLAADTASLAEHSAFLANNLTFLMDAALGLISIEQNAGMKVFSWIALVFLPPTLIAGIYGMNFEHMPELDWLYGYPMALALILASAILPVWILKRRGLI
jgi:magnesium transporter